MNAILSKREQAIVDELQRLLVATKKTLIGQIECSAKTCERALKKVGYCTSLNKNAAYHTLLNIAQFDENGLWWYQDTCFSRYGTVDKTIIALIERSEEGYTVEQMNNQLKTNTANLLSRLCRSKRLNKFLIDHRAVYISVDAQQGAAQKNNRLYPHYPSGLPDNIDALTVIQVLIQVIQTPKATNQELITALKARKAPVSTLDLEQIISFYEIKKNANP